MASSVDNHIYKVDQLPTQEQTPAQEEQKQQSRSFKKSAWLVTQAVFWTILSVGRVFCMDSCWRRATILWAEIKNEGATARRPSRRLSEWKLSSIYGDDLDLLEIDNDAIPSEEESRRERVRGAIHDLQASGQFFDSGGMLKDGTVETYVEFLRSQYGKEAGFQLRLIHALPYGDHVKFIKDLMLPTIKEARKDGKSLVFIPFVQGKLGGVIGRKHIVLLAINLKDHTIEYYDSKNSDGKKFMWKAKLPVLSGVTDKLFRQTVLEQLNELDGQGESGQAKWKVIQQEQGARHQRGGDHSNCGAFVSKFMKERLIAAKKDDSSEIAFRATCKAVGRSKKIREEMVQDLMEISS